MGSLVSRPRIGRLTAPRPGRPARRRRAVAETASPARSGDARGQAQPAAKARERVVGHELHPAASVRSHSRRQRADAEAGGAERRHVALARRPRWRRRRRGRAAGRDDAAGPLPRAGGRSRCPTAGSPLEGLVADRACRCGSRGRARERRPPAARRARCRRLTAAALPSRSRSTLRPPPPPSRRARPRGSAAHDTRSPRTIVNAWLSERTRTDGPAHALRLERDRAGAHRRVVGGRAPARARPRAAGRSRRAGRTRRARRAASLASRSRACSASSRSRGASTSPARASTRACPSTSCAPPRSASARAPKLAERLEVGRPPRRAPRRRAAVTGAPPAIAASTASARAFRTRAASSGRPARSKSAAARREVAPQLGAPRERERARPSAEDPVEKTRHETHRTYPVPSLSSARLVARTADRTLQRGL